MGLVTQTAYVAGATITAAGQNTNEQAIFNEFNGNIENVNIKASAGIVDSKLAQISTASKVSYAAVTAVPSFSVTKGGSDQGSVVTSTPTLLTWSTEVFDTNSNFASNKFTVTVAGKYFITSTVQFNALGDGKTGNVYIYKNGAASQYGQSIAQGAAAAQTRVTATVILSLVATDYIEVYVEHDKGSDATIEGDAPSTYFMGYMISV